jgi:hypothetical protein
VGDLVRRLFELLHAELGVRRGGGADAHEQVRIGVGLHRRAGQVAAEQIDQDVPVLHRGEPRQHRLLELEAAGRRALGRIDRQAADLAVAAAEAGRQRHQERRTPRNLSSQVAAFCHRAGARPPTHPEA